ncbi:hypothetical protein [Streptomyces sp. NPDC056527]|uniref:hypothetical protein n=1 Tax=Streptomyces sp. NPDC056527 TaxID=3345853 RepID=UPI0036AAAFA1
MIAILGLVVSVATAVVGYRHGHDAKRAQQMRDEREEQTRRQREEQTERTERIRQASWISSYVEAGGSRVTVYNGSSQPVIGVRVLAGDDVLRPGRVGLLMPGGSSTFVVSSEVGVRELDPAGLAVEFTDVAGRTWRRTAEGKLHERVSPEGAPSLWGPPMVPLVEPYRSPSTQGERGDTRGGSVLPPPNADRPTGPPSGPLSGSAPPSPVPGVESPAPAGGQGGPRGRGAFSWRSLFLIGCLGAAAALAYLIARLV